MATWSEVQDYLRARFDPAADQPTWLGLCWWSGPQRSGDRQEVCVELGEDHFGHPVVVISSDVGAQDRLAAASALAHNAMLTIGALAVRDRRYQLRSVHALDGLAWPVLARVLEFVGREAFRLRGMLAPARPTHGPDLFVNYVD
jgi:hypothetical protein